MSERRSWWFWWSRHGLTFPWRPFYVGIDEYHRRTFGVRLPGGVLFLAPWRACPLDCDD